jgi:endonuclease III-like uncharacterized protein
MSFRCARGIYRRKFYLHLSKWLQIKYKKNIYCTYLLCQLSNWGETHQQLEKLIEEKAMHDMTLARLRLTDQIRVLKKLAFKPLDSVNLVISSLLKL